VKAPINLSPKLNTKKLPANNFLLVNYLITIAIFVGSFYFLYTGYKNSIKLSSLNSQEVQKIKNDTIDVLSINALNNTNSSINLPGLNYITENSYNFNKNIYYITYQVPHTFNISELTNYFGEYYFFKSISNKYIIKFKYVK